MQVEKLSGEGLRVRASPRRPSKAARRRCRVRLAARRGTLSGTPLRSKTAPSPLKAAAMDMTLTKDIYCAEPWWSRNPAPNMTTINSAAEMLNALQNAGNRLVVIDFYAKWCRSCRALHPKLSQICRSNPNVLVLKVDWDDNMELCQVMGVKALPFFHFYQSPFGCVDSFTISVSRVRKLKDTIAVYSVPMETQVSHLTGVDSPALDLQTGVETVAAKLNKLQQIFAIA